MAEIRRVYLECETNGHSKYYEAWIEVSSSHHILYTRYGKIGTRGTTHEKDRSVYSNLIIDQFDKLVVDKVKKGYVVMTPPKTIKEDKVIKSVDREFQRFDLLID